MISISVIIPVYNEDKTILEILKKINLIKNIANFEVIVINDGSTDNTKKLIDENTRLYDLVKHLKHNKGKGEAVIEGLRISTKEYIFFQDADLEYDPKDLMRFIEIVNNYHADLVMGNRFSGKNRSVLLFWHMIGNKFISFFFNLLNNTTFSDIYCCYCLFQKRNLPINKLNSKGWGQHAEILTYLSNNSKKIFETSVNYDGRRYSEGKKIRYYHIFGVIYWIVFTKLKILLTKK